MSKKVIKKILYVPEKIENLMTRRRHDKKNWTHIYFYKDNKKTEIDGNNIEEYEIITGGCYKNNVFYRCTNLCKNDEVFDYYKILKPEHKEPVMCVKSKKETIKKKAHNKKKKVFEIKHFPPEKPFILKFD